MNDFLKIAIVEFKAVGTSIPILIVFVLGNIGYGFLYNLMYGTNVLRDAPIAIVDKSQTSLSQDFINYLDATPQVSIYSTIPDFRIAEDLLKEGKIIGIIYIPQEFQSNINKGIQTTFSVYGSTLSFIDYLNLSEASNFASINLNVKLLPDMVQKLSIRDELSIVNVKPVNLVGTAVFNPSEGYGTYLIPPVMMVIIFQTLMMGVAMMCGTEREKRHLNSGLSILSINSAVKTVFAKAIVNVLIYFVISLFFLGLLPILFDLPHLSRALNIMILIIPYLFVTVFFCLSFSPFFTDGDMPLFMIVFMSVPLIFLSGISYPLELMPWYWRAVHYIIPAAPATLAFVKMNCMGADIYQIKPELLTLWIQCGVYCLTAIFMYRRSWKRL